MNSLIGVNNLRTEEISSNEFIQLQTQKELDFYLQNKTLYHYF